MRGGVIAVADLCVPSAEKLQDSASAALDAHLAREIRGMERTGITATLRLSDGAMNLPLQPPTTNAL